MQNKAIQTAEKQPAAPVTRSPHNLILENRHMVTATGVTRIVSYDDTAASLETQQGALTIGGRGIQVSELSLQTGEMKIYGQIDYIQYAEEQESGGGLFRHFWR